MNHFTIITNPYTDKEHKLSELMIRYIEEKGGRCNCIMLEEQEIECGVEAAFVFGGDGTLIRAARAVAEKQIPLIGVNLGHLGYLCELEENQVFYAIDQMMSDNFILEERMMLKGHSSSKKTEEKTALNDIVITRSNGLQIIQLILYVNGEYLTTYHGDGIIVATPTGSTGYSMSAGGPIIEPKAEMILVTPVNAHELNTKSIVLGAEDEITIEIGMRKREQEEKVQVYFDGEEAAKLQAGDSISIHASPRKTRILKLSKLSFLEILRKKMQINS